MRAAAGSIVPVHRALCIVVPLVACLALACAGLEAARLDHSARAALSRGEPAQAVADLERAAAIAPHVSAIQNHLGIAYEQAGRPQDAEGAYERALALDCENEAARANLEALRAGEGPGQ